MSRSVAELADGRSMHSSELDEVVAAWPRLSPALRAAVLAIVRSPAMAVEGPSDQLERTES